MAIVKLDIESFIEMSKHSPVVDVRSPSEYAHAHIPGAYSLPLFNDEERKEVGTTYKQKSRKEAVKLGLDYFGPKMRSMVEEAEKILQNVKEGNNIEGQTSNSQVLVHCWRGGMRSAGVAWLLDLYGFKVYTLTGGYKTFRTWTLLQFNNSYQVKILGGFTGSGKTVLLKKMQEDGETVIDLEGLAHHKGSAFGALGEAPQPSQEMFENRLAVELHRNSERTIWLEDESQRIGKMIIPNPIWATMRNSPVYFLDIPFEERLKHIIEGYGSYDKTGLAESIQKIQKKLGGLETKNALSYLEENNFTECFRILLAYYDKLYAKSLKMRENWESLVTEIACEAVESANTKRLLL